MVDNNRDMLRMRVSCLCKLLNAAEKYTLFSYHTGEMGDKLILRPLVICGPSGSGKSSLLKKLFNEYPDTFGFSVSHTTRSPRKGERPGVDYHYLTVDEMQKEINQGKFIEHAIFSGNIYGTSKKAVEDVKNIGKICVLDIEVQGVQQVKKTDLNPLYVFVKPPSIKDLEDRLRARGTETENSLQLRLTTAAKEMEYGVQENFDLIVENDNLDTAYESLKGYLAQELHIN